MMMLNKGRSVVRTLPNIYDEAFSRKLLAVKAALYFRKRALS